jgi:hypothetical protein
MIRNIIVILLICVLVYLGWHWWQGHEQKVAQDGGTVTCVEGCETPEQKSLFDKENAGETPDGQSEHKTESARVAAEKAENGTLVTTAPDGSVVNPTMTPPPQSGYSAGSSQAPVVVPTTPQQPYGYAGAPMTDSQSPNAQNGMRFAGSGAYLVYRQGDITYRMDTTTGHSCVIYATMEEWRKPLVMSHGCGRTA